MTFRVCIPMENNFLSYKEKAEISQWMKDQGIWKAHDMTEFVWSRKPVYYLRMSAGTGDPVYATSDQLRAEVTHAHFYFRDADHALMFKLAWGGLTSR